MQFPVAWYPNYHKPAARHLLKSGFLQRPSPWPPSLCAELGSGTDCTGHQGAAGPHRKSEWRLGLG